MTITGDRKGVRKSITLFHEHLVTYAPPGGVEVHTVLPTERFDRCVLGQVLVGLVLNVMVYCKDRLRWVVYPRRAD